MSRFLRLSLLVTAILLMIACGLSANSQQGSNSILTNSIVQLAVQAQPTTFNSVGQIINYTYTVTNTGTSPLTGPVTITDNKTTVLCPDLKTVGNKNDKLDPTEALACASAYNTAQEDVTAGAVTSASQAHIAGNDSNPVTTVVTLALNKVLTITVSANPTSYGQVGQTITYTYTIKNTGTSTLGPAQFVVNDNRFTAPINCDNNTKILAPNDTVTCTAQYTISQNDMTVAQLTNTVSAMGASAGTIQAATVTVNNTNVIANPGTSPSTTIPRGSTVHHPVSAGEWLLQIARCYGADFDAVLRANPQIVDPDLIYVPSTVTVPNVGSVAPVYGPPCIKPYTVKAGDSWASIANDPSNNAALDVLMEANKDITLAPGKVITIPLNSKGYGGTTSPTPSPVTQPITLTFSAANPTVTKQGNIGTPGTVRYVFTGAAGQLLAVKLSVPTNDLGFAVYGPNNTTLKALDSNTSWNGTLAANGDHFIDVISTLGAANKTYTIEVTLTTPTPASPFQLVTDNINPGPGDSKPSYLSVFNGSLYFQATANNNLGPEIWKYDAGLNAASRLADTVPRAAGITPAFLTPFQNLLYFSADGHDSAGVELWRFNGSAVGRVTDLNPKEADSNPMYLTEFNNALYFSAKGSDNKGMELWKFDGNTTTQVTAVNPDVVSNPAYLAVFNGVLYFSGTSVDGGTELWKYDGTSAALVKDINKGVGNSNPAFLTVFNNALYFSADGNNSAGTELWKFDGTDVTLASDINKSPDGSVPTYLTVFNKALYFSAKADASGFEIWKFDGTNATRVSDINPTGDANPQFLTVYNSELYFQANDGKGAGAELWKFTGP